MKLLLLSNSTNFGEEYLAYSREVIAGFLKEHKERIVFIPFAGVTMDWDDYTDKVNQALASFGIEVKGIHRHSEGKSALQEASAIMVGGGNTFQLLEKLYKQQLINTLREKVEEGIPYIGWSAGANMACPSLMTTNDMPIIEPPTFHAIEVIPFQINPHYTEEVVPDHGGESREVRLLEFIEVNREVKVVGLPEGMIIKRINDQYSLLGDKGCKVFQYGQLPEWIKDDKAFNDFINS